MWKLEVGSNSLAVVGTNVKTKAVHVMACNAPETKIRIDICECKIEILTGKVEAVEQIVREGGSKTLPKPSESVIGRKEPSVMHMQRVIGYVGLLLQNFFHFKETIRKMQNVNVLVDWLKFDP
ncbi:hypothetical protein HID58_067173 [Brassica napus]|uniref:Uncharacterized protein n=1 Tax=Brassica napus TaxID=3708 RepID=A0ABQ7ZHS2_BRANA|nr:hypothetical protein HID58_067173 [Brassica napus]